jgi:bifunctional UDP-N-acetylglucosamine pyrophosphorylase/glucosamine-1-phosphate N-acetyltransferase
MKSFLPKVVHKVGGKCILNRVIDTVNTLKPKNVVVVLGHENEKVEKFLSGYKGIKIVKQEKQLGSGHAIMQAESIFKNYNGNVLVVSGDVPLIKSSTLKKLINNCEKEKVAAAVLSAEVEEPFGYGRIIRRDGFLEKIVEEKDADSFQKKIREINSGIYCFSKSLWGVLPKIKNNNANKEYYITDAIALLKEQNEKVSVMKTADICEIKGVNNRKELAEIEDILKKRKIENLLENGITIIDKNNIYIADDAKIGQDTKIYPNAFIDRGVVIGENCIIKGNSYIANSKIGNEVIVSYSYIDGAEIKDNAKIGPFAHIRPDTLLKENVKIGNFSETKKSVIGKNSKVNHLSYIGDCEIGENVNVGAGTITCNYDGEKKHKTVIGDNSFVGSNVNFVAPVKIGKNVLVGAGSTITKDVESGKFAIARMRQQNFRKIK